MGAIADGFVAYSQPLLDQTDGSIEQMNKALAIGQLCFNLALTPEESREEFLGDIRSSLKMDDAEFEAFQSTIITPMLRRHQEMFPRMHQRVSSVPSPSRISSGDAPRMGSPAELYPGTNRYAPCPCNSGEKYKFCCGKKR